MKTSSYPATYQSASELSARFQKNYFRSLKWHMLLLIIAAVISVINSPLPCLAILQAIILLCALGCAVFLYTTKPDKHWYSARALAESVKTSTWRFIMKAEPFNNPDDQDRHNFTLRLKQIVDANKDISSCLTEHLEQTQISDEMNKVRGLTAEDRLEYYRNNRILEQLSWYASKASFNKKTATIYYLTLVVVILVAVAFSLMKIKFSSAPYWPTDVFVIVAASLLSWIQAKRYQELSVSYSLTAHEISFIRQSAGVEMGDNSLSKFVGDAENAFSREHTQWLARRDS